MDKCYIKIKALCEEYTEGSSYTIDDLKKSSLGKTLTKLFKAGFVNTSNRHNTLEAIHSNYSYDAGGWSRWDMIVFGDDECNKVFYMTCFTDDIDMSFYGKEIKRVSIKHILSL